jgi:mannose-6-phosphate isomerase-like protein (cupin superfamily)
MVMQDSKEGGAGISRWPADGFFSWGDQCSGWWLKEGGHFAVIAEIMPPGTAEVWHVHDQTEQFFYILEGSLVMETRGEEDATERRVMQAHEGHAVPAAVPHRVCNHTQHPVSFLVISAPDHGSDRRNLG